MAESPGEAVVRRGIEKSITTFRDAGDGRMSDHWLDRWAHNKLRPDISLERAHAIACSAIRNSNQPTEDIPVITPEMLDAEMDQA